MQSAGTKFIFQCSDNCQRTSCLRKVLLQIWCSSPESSVNASWFTALEPGSDRSDRFGGPGKRRPDEYSHKLIFFQEFRASLDFYVVCRQKRTKSPKRSSRCQAE